ncbi:guanine-N(7)-methyltransferase [Calocera viscosa TUFC12733]|uniref:mRNA cap guanine-N(7) methyltransferase n=1 Tax=Calocera viscosa (strain TUFC12733) TaxID=1330018 RepID=A0A167NMW6_CALVF|nr:guanine-N(7)-methyltransferase [Calocera viscosa TUFC12733]
MPFDPVREAAYGERERATTATTSTGRSTSPTSPLFTPVGVPPSPSVKKFSLANILNDDPALDPSLRSPEARISSSSSYLDYSSSPVFDAAGRYSPSGPTRGAYSPSRPTSGKRQREEDALRTPPPKRRAPSGPDDLSAVVAGHCRTARRESPIIALKNFNNWVKSVLIQKYGRVGRGGRDALVRVLDIGCGKGGDLLKWSKNGVGEYIGLDVAEISVRQAEERYLDMRQWRMRAYFQALDCYRESIRDALPKEVFASPFQTVSMQFCMHYAFYSEHAVRTMLDNVATNLEQGGTFIGTIPNAEHILRHRASLPPGELTFGNPVFRITFPHPPPAPPAPEEQDQSAAFGHKYNFFLQDAVGEDEAGVPEYLVHWPNFVRLAAEYGLVQEYRKDFADLLNEEREHEVYGPLLRRMKVIDAAGESDMDEEQWEAASIYLAFAFRKR